MATPRSDALVLFGVTGDLAHKMIFPTFALRDGHPGTRRRGAGGPCARHRREAIPARPGLRTGAQPRRTVGVPGRLDLPYRPLFGGGGDHEHPLFPLRQLLPGADLERNCVAIVQVTLSEDFGVRWARPSGWTTSRTTLSRTPQRNARRRWCPTTQRRAEDP
jgi:hypothetical protein